jgi:carbonic anhydrase
VSWNVMRTPIEVSSEQIAKFTAVYSGNARPVQPLNRRIVKIKKF